MMEVNGIAVQISTDELAKEKGLWWDSDAKSETGKKGFGIVLGLRAGTWFEPIAFFSGNTWFNGKHWFVVPKIPFIYPFLSVSIGKSGFYLGWKSYGVDLDGYKAWAKPEDIYDGNTALSLSVSIRRTRTN